MSGLTVRLRAEVGALCLSVAMDVPGTGVTGVFGPSGSGKTTLLRCISGLHRAAEGRIHWDGDVWQDEASGVFRPPHERRVGYVSQHADLFPHLSVHGNLRYGADRSGPGREVGSWEEVIEWLQLAPLLSRGVGRLSGGERQRVALGRALLARPRVLLLDEPLSALDEPARRDVLDHLEPVLARLELPVIYVSHALQDVARLADHFAWIREGRVAESGPVAAMLGQLDFAAWLGDERGVVLAGEIVAHDREFALTTIRTALGPVTVARRDDPVGARVRLQIKARDVSLGLAGQEVSSILNELELTVRAVAELSASDCLVQMGRDGAEAVLLGKITRKSQAQLRIEPGRRVFARVKSVAVLD